MRHLQRCAYAGVFSLFLLSPVQASVLIGNVIHAEYDVNFLNYPDSNAFPDQFTVGPGVETIINVEHVTDLVVDFSDTSLVITLLTTLMNPDPTWGSTSQNGPKFSVVSGNPFPAIKSVTSTLKPLELGPVSVFLLDGALFVNWAGRSYQNGDTVTVSFETPLPAALPLFASGLTGLGFLGWWRRRKNGAI
jgi:hypothetical protein